MQDRRSTLRNVSLAIAAGMIALSALTLAQPALGQELTSEGAEPEQAAKLAKTLQNPVASLIVVPFQNNFDWGAGPNDDGFQWKMNIQPVVPILLSEDWNLIVRTILPVVSQTDIAGTRQNPSGTQTGLSDTLSSFFFSPKALGPGGVIWGAGPALYFPTGTDDLLGTGKWGAGPTAVALRQSGGWTYGALVNHIWSYAGSGSRPDLNNRFLQPFVAYTTKKSTTFGMNSETQVTTGRRVNGWSPLTPPWPNCRKLEASLCSSN